MKSTNDFKLIRPKVKDFTNKLEILLRSLLDSKQLNYHLIESRTKSIESFEDKIIRKGSNYINPIEEITDLSGLRIIVYYQKDLNTIDKLLRKYFWIDPDNSVNKIENYNSNEFGYLSNHYVIKIESPRIDLPEWEQFTDFKAEIQLRTVLQHAWAAISHELQYKSKAEVPSTLKRRLYRLAGLFELADEEFGTIKEKQSEVHHAIQNKIKIDNRKVFEEINLETIRAFFNSNTEIIKFYANVAENVGFSFHIPEDIIEDKELIIDRQYSEIIEIVNNLNLDTIPKFENFLKNRKHEAKAYFTLQFNAQTPDSEGNRRWIVSDEFIIKLFLMKFISEDNLKKFANKAGWSKAIINRIIKVILTK